MKKLPKEIYVGEFDLGFESVELYALRDTGNGAVYFQPNDGKLPRIDVGIDYDTWAGVVQVLLHEAHEFSMTRRQLRFSQSLERWGDHSAYLFNLNHVQFSEVCSDVAVFITPALPKLEAIYRKSRRSRH